MEEIKRAIYWNEGKNQWMEISIEKLLVLDNLPNDFIVTFEKDWKRVDLHIMLRGLDMRGYKLISYNDGEGKRYYKEVV